MSLPPELTSASRAADRPGGPRLALLALFAFAFAAQGLRHPWEPDEGRYVAVALEMLRLGDWATPMIHHEIPHFTKPPLTYWVVAASLAAFGRSELAARLPNALAFFLTTLLVFRLGRLFVPRAPYLPALLYATSLLPFAAANIVTTDTLLTLWETLAVTGFAELWLAGARRGARVMWVGFGLAFLTKGPPGLLPLFAILAFVAVTRVLPLRALWSGVGCALFLAIGFGWYAVMVTLRPDLLPYLLGREVVDRVTSGIYDRNSGLLGWIPAYVPVLLGGMLPWAALALVRRRGEAPAPAAAGRFLLTWLLVPLAVFFAVPSRLPLYLLPLAVPAAVLLARRLPPGLLDSRRARLAVAAWALAILGLRLAAGLLPSSHDPRPLAEWIRGALGHAPYEVIFVGMRPVYGLSFYLDAEVERVDEELPGFLGPAYRPLTEPIADEVAEKEGETVYLVRAGARESFERDIAGLGWASRARGRFRGLVLYGPLVRTGEPR